MSTKLRSLVGEIMHSGVDLLVGNTNASEHLQNLNDASTAMLDVLGDQPSTSVPATPSVSRSTPSTSSNQSGTVSINQEALLQLVNMTRRFVRYSREGNIPSKEQRKYARRSIKAVKHLLPPREQAAATF